MPGSPSFITGRLLAPTGEPISGAECIFVPEPTVPQDPIYASFKTLKVLTQSNGKLETSISGLAIWPGTYRLRVGGTDILRIKVPDDGAIHALTSLLF